jgi:hypothetical protein
MRDVPFSAGYVMIEAGTEDVHGLRQKLLSIDAVRIAHALIGPDDMICFVDAQDPVSFRHAIDSQIRALIDSGNIRQTETLLILDRDGKGYSGEENRPAPAAAWLLSQVGIGNPQSVVDALLQIPGVRNAHSVLGRYDVIAYLEAASVVDLMRTLDLGIRKIPQIRRTDTRLVLMEIDVVLPDRNRSDQHRVGASSD